LTFKVTEKNINGAITTCTRLRNDDVSDVKLDHAVIAMIAAAVRQWRRRLSACVRAAVVISSTACNSDIVFVVTAAFEVFV